MKCPNCDFIERDELWGEPATCPKCSAIYEKALRTKELRAQLAGKKQQGLSPEVMPKKRHNLLAKKGRHPQ